MKFINGWPAYMEPEVPRVADQIKAGADVRKGLSGRMPMGFTDYNNVRHELVTESYPKSGRKFQDEE